MTKEERIAMMRGAAYMREKIAQALECSPRKPHQEAGAHVREHVKLPPVEIVEASSGDGGWLDFVIADELRDRESTS